MTADLGNFGAARVRRLLGATCLVPLAASMMLASPASAQDAAAPADAAPTKLASADTAADSAAAGEIVVTGSRLGGGFTAPTPVTSVGQAQIQQRGITAVAELLQEVPQLRINQNIGKSSEPVGQSCVDLRGLNISNSSCPRTLVLLDGRRIAATSPFGGIDTNIFPVSLISNVNVVTGGASAAYGSDAVAGVVNFEINKTLEGFKADVSYGESKYNDFKRPVISAAVGHSFFDNRLHIEVAGDYYRNSGETAQGTRPWGRNETILVSNPQSATNGLPASYIGDGARFSYMTPGGVIAVSPTVAPAGLAALRGIQFIPGGTTTFRYGSPIGGTFAIGGDGGTVEDDGNILPLIKRWSAYGRADFEISDNIKVWGDFLHSRVTVFSDLAPNPDAPTVSATGVATGGITIQQNNAYLPANVRTIMQANNLSSFVMGRINLEDGFSQNNSISRAERFAGGFEGSFGKWKWDVTAQRSSNYFRQDSVNNRIQANWFFGLDTVYYNPANNNIFTFGGGATTPPAGYVISCRALVPGSSTYNPTAAAGCVPINPFGAGSISQAALNYYRGTSWYYSFQHQNIFSANLKGSPFATWAGDVLVAIGGEYRKEDITEVSDPLSQGLRAWRSINQQGLSGKLNVKEVYGEVAVPLAKDAPFAKDLELNGAIRYADYSTSGGVTTWKVGLNYVPISDIRFRGTYSRDIRAANINELFSGQNQVIASYNDVRAGAPLPAYLMTSLSGGNASLKPEKAKTLSFGAVLQPTFLEGFHASVDYYRIKLKNAIGTITPNATIANCAAGQSAYCALLTIDPASNKILTVQATYINTQEIDTKGVDIELSYRVPVTILQQNGGVTFHALANHVAQLAVTTPGSGTIDHVADLGNPDAGGVPEWRLNYDITYSGGPLKLGVYYRYISGGRYGVPPSSTPTDPAQNHFHGRQYFDLSAAYKLTSNVEIYGKIDNLFNRYPPILPNAITQPTVAGAQMYDKIGRFFVAGVRVNF